MPDSISHEIDALFERLKKRADQRQAEDERGAHEYADRTVGHAGSEYNDAWTDEMARRRAARASTGLRKIIIQGRVYWEATDVRQDVVYICRHCDERCVDERSRCSRCGPVTVSGWPVRTTTRHRIHRASRNWEHMAQQADSEPGPAARERQDLLDRCRRLLDSGLPHREVGRRLGLSKGALHRLLQELGR